MLPTQTICRSLVLFSAITLFPTWATADIYELRTYTTNEGKLDDLHARFRDHTVKLFTKHGMESVGYWVPTDEAKSQNTLIYLLRHKSRDAAKASWQGFVNDSDWKKAFAASRADGPLVKAVQSVFMNETDYSPKFKTESSDEAVYELRIYKTNEGKLANLDARFRDHTIGIFDRYGLQSVGYWHPADEPDAKDTLIYILRHKSPDAAKRGWKSFAADDEWKKVAKESQKDGKFLRERPTSIYMQSTDYSAIR
jgi:hypothetical protein